MRAKEVVVRDTIQKGYTYLRTEPAGKNFAEDFNPKLVPQEMLELGVFDGVYLNDCRDEFPKSWFTCAKLSDGRPNAKLNYFGVHASQSLSVWQKKGWIYKDDPRGWFQWYCRYYLGRRIPKEDERQIKRWRQMVRHVAQIKYACRAGDATCHPRQRQALLHWAYDSRRV